MTFKDGLRRLLSEAMNYPTDDLLDTYVVKFGEFFQNSLRFDYSITARMADEAEIVASAEVGQAERTLAE